MRYLLPGAAHPHPRRAAADLSQWLGVDAQHVSSWIAAGLPTAGGLIDAFEAVNWLAQHPGRAPVLDCRWQRFLRWFAPFVEGRDRPALRRMERRHRLCLPDTCSAAEVSWWLPRVESADETWQVEVDLLPTHVRVLHPQADAVATAAMPCRPQRQDLSELVPMVEAVVDGFRYGYRHHRPDDEYHGRRAGSCLDLAFAVGDELSQRGRPWRLCAGVIAHTALANPHFWLEVATPGGGYAPIDPSLPAIRKTYAALMPPDTPDWRAWVRAYTGGCDARRVTLRRGDIPLRSIPGGPTIGSLIGEAVTSDGSNAWLCLDWVCGECRYEFSATR